MGKVWLSSRLALLRFVCTEGGGSRNWKPGRIQRWRVTTRAGADGPEKKKEEEEQSGEKREYAVQLMSALQQCFPSNQQPATSNRTKRNSAGRQAGR